MKYELKILNLVFNKNLTFPIEELIIRVALFNVFKEGDGSNPRKWQPSFALDRYSWGRNRRR